VGTPLAQAIGLQPIAEVNESRRRGPNDWYSNEGESISSSSDYKHSSSKLGVSPMYQHYQFSQSH